MIDKTAIIDPKAKISEDVKIGAYAVIGPNVEIGENTNIQNHVSVVGNTKIGRNNKIYPFSSIGNDPQDLKFKGEETYLEIGDNNLIREYVTINPGTVGGGGITKVGSNCLFMVSSHVAHDCKVGNNVILANNVPLGGHAEIADDVIIGGNSAVQQFTRIGKSAMIGGMCGVLKDVIPYGIVHGNRGVLQGINLIGLRRKKISNKIIMELSDAYKKIFKNNNIFENLENLSPELKESLLVKDVVKFLTDDKKRPICSPYYKDENNR
jgi:UDP-N-acetylglucosamine acyltransferase